VSDTRRGAIFGATAYLLWGVFPLYVPLLDPSGPVEVLAHRITWSLVVMAVVVVVSRKQASVRRVVADRRRLAQLAAAAVLLGVNWGVYIYGVTSDHVVETSLGYFINPLVTVLLGVFVLREQLRPVQRVALVIASVAVLTLSVENGRPPWIALILAFCFGMYGLLKKTARVGAVEGLAVETAVLVPLAVAYLVVVGARGESTFVGDGVGHATLLVLTGVITAVPLLFFGAAASRVPLTTLGPLQYLAPTVQFLIGVLVFGERLGPLKLVGFVLVWIALAFFTADLVGHTRRARLRVPVAEPV
jgi:chloramphenicol-sensitive protein RarD